MAFVATRLRARWDGVRQRFYHWRTKFGFTFAEEIAHN
jgi:hypothetical protein